MQLRLIPFVCGLTALLPSSMSTAGEPILIAQGTEKNVPKQPQAAVADDGTVHLVYGVGDEVVHCQSTGSGESFTPPKAAFRTANMSLGMRRGPRLAIAGSNLVISAIGGVQGKGRDGDVLVWRSVDNGTSWQGPVRVNDVPDSAREGLHAMTASSAGAVWCVWLDLRAKGTQLYAARSDDGGASWTKNILVYKSPGGSVCECCHPSIVAHGESVHVLFRNSLQGDRDMYVVSSPDGQQFGPAKRLGTEHWPLKACPMDGGMLAVESDGQVSTVWRRGGLVYATEGGSLEEILLGRGEQPWLTATRKGAVAVWIAKREGELFVTPLSKLQPRRIAMVARDPVIASSPSGDGQVFVCWESKRGDKYVIEGITIDVF